MTFIALARRLSLAESAVAVAVCVVSVSMISDTMRESDQASILDGGIALSRGDVSPWRADFYNYDRQFLTYWVVAAVVSVSSSERAVSPERLLFATNLAASLILWVGVAGLVVCRARGDRLVAALVAAIVVAPSLLLSSGLLCSNIVSGGFLAVLAALLYSKRFRAEVRLSLVAGLTFAAVGARADAVLCLPFLCWVSVPASRFRALLLKPEHWASSAGAIAALALGEWVKRSDSILFYPSPFVFRIVAAYSTFGLGASLGVVALLIGLISWRIARSTTARRKNFFVLGLVCALLPLVFYGAQLVSPRHWLTTIWVMLFFVTSRRGRAMMRLGLRPQARRVLAVAALLGAFVPMVIGVHLPALSSPRLIVRDATLYPSADGLWPMGAYADFIGALRRASREPIDHNQEIWAALGQTPLPSVDGPEKREVPLYWTPMLSYFKLAATLQGKRGVQYSRSHYDAAPFLIGDERTLRKDATPLSRATTLNREQARLGHRPKTLVSPSGLRQPIVKIEALGSLRASEVEIERRLAVTSCFAGDEFTVRPVGEDEWKWSPSRRGKMVVFFSDAPFVPVVHFGGGRRERVRLESMAYDVPNGERRRVYVARIDPTDSLSAARVELNETTAPLYAAQAVLPGYMSVSSLH